MLPGENVNADALRSRIERCSEIAAASLLAERNASGFWTGELSSSALSTATVLTALAIVDRARSERRHEPEIKRGLAWLVKNQNPDGSWGDTVVSHGNISTTTLCWSAFAAARSVADANYLQTETAAEAWLGKSAGGIDPAALSHAIIQRYGNDRTFSAPILTMCALAGRLGTGAAAWRHVIPLPFELAAFPDSWFAALRLPVVSYALPALIAIGQARHHHAPSAKPCARAIRNLARQKTLRKLANIQPSSGGFLEATPLTGFVVMSLASIGETENSVTRNGVKFLEQSQRADGSWAIDTNLATWCTTLALNALDYENLELESADEWLLNQQYRVRHAYTNAPAGGWAWTDLPGGVPDADDTAGALLVLAHCVQRESRVRTAGILGINWLLDLQNNDGGVPTFCRGWTNLPFDRSSPDITAHALRAWFKWTNLLPKDLAARVGKAVGRAITFLRASQAQNGSWSPLWFGNQHRADEENPVYGTARVLLAFALAPIELSMRAEKLITSGVSFILAAQHDTGSWGDSSPETASVEETALALETLAELAMAKNRAVQSAASMFPLQRAIESAADWLASRVEIGKWKSLRRSDFILRSFGITNGCIRKSSQWVPSMQPAVF